MEPLEMENKEPRQLDVLTGRLERSLCRFDEEMGRLRGIAERLLGPVPVADENRVSADLDDGCIGALHMRVGHLELFLEDLTSELNRLERV